MLLNRAFSVCHVLMLVLCLSAAEDFDWTKNEHGSFYYGTFPTGTSIFPFMVLFLFMSLVGVERLMLILLVRIFMGRRQFGLSNRRSLGQRRKRTEHLGCVYS